MFQKLCYFVIFVDVVLSGFLEAYPSFLSRCAIVFICILSYYHQFLFPHFSHQPPLSLPTTHFVSCLKLKKNNNKHFSLHTHENRCSSFIFFFFLLRAAHHLSSILADALSPLHSQFLHITFQSLILPNLHKSIKKIYYLCPFELYTS